MLMEAGAPAVLVAEVATEVNAVPGSRPTEMGHSLVEILPFGRTVHSGIALGSTVADASRRSTEAPEDYRQLCDAAMLRLRAFLLEDTAHAPCGNMQANAR